MLDLARLDQAGVDPLIFVKAALLDEKAAAILGERDDFDALNRAPASVAAQIDVLGFDQPLVA